MHPFTANADLVARRVDRDRAGLKRSLRFLTPPQNCPDSLYHFARTKGLVTSSSAPNSKPTIRSTSSAFAVNIRIGM